MKVTQIAFPERSGTAPVNGYEKGMSGYTCNANDNIFCGDSAGIEMSAVNGNLTDGFALAIKLNVP